MRNSSILKQFQKRKSCYYCGAPGPSSKEHAPIKKMFEAFDCDSITVPACDLHNSSRSQIDRAVLVFFLRGLEYGFRSGSLTNNQIDAYELARHKLGYAKEVTTPPLVVDPRGELDTTASYIDETTKVETYMRQLTAAMVWSVTGEVDPSINWDEATTWSPHFVAAKGPSDILEVGLQLKRQESVAAVVRKRALHWWSGWSPFPRGYPHDIYHFEASLVPSQYMLRGGNEQEVIFAHRFYGEFTWYVWFVASEQTKRRIAEVLQAICD